MTLKMRCYSFVYFLFRMELTILDSLSMCILGFFLKDESLCQKAQSKNTALKRMTTDFR